MYSPSAGKSEMSKRPSASVVAVRRTPVGRILDRHRRSRQTVAVVARHDAGDRARAALCRRGAGHGQHGQKRQERSAREDFARRSGRLRCKPRSHGEVCHAEARRAKADLTHQTSAFPGDSSSIHAW